MFNSKNLTIKSNYSEFTQKIFQKIDFQMKKGPGSKLNKKSKFVDCFVNFDFENMKSPSRLKVGPKEI
jgi:hypothetical protein